MIPELLNRDTPSNPAAPSPVSPATLMGGGSFFSQEDTGFFDSPVLTRKPLKETKASELGFATAVMSTDDPVDMAGISQATINSLMSYGASTEMESIRKQIQQADEVESYRSLWTNDTFLTSAQLNPQLAREVQADAQAELQALKFQSDSARIMAEAAAKLTPAQRELAQNMSFVTEEIMYQQSIEQVLSGKIASDEEKGSFWNWAATLSPLSPITSRSDQKKLVQIVSENLGVDPSNYVFKSDHGKMLEQYFLDPKLTMSQALDRVTEAEELFNSIDYEEEGINPLWGSEFFDTMRSTLRSKGETVTVGNLTDTLDATFIAADSVALVKGLSKLSAGLSAKIFGKAAVMSRKSTPEDIEQVMQAMEEQLKPKLESVGTPSGLLTETPVAAPTGKATRAKEIEEELTWLRNQASGTVPRKERKELEARKQELGSEIAALASDDLNALTKQFQAEGMKFKDAKKRAAAEVEQQKLSKQAELDELQSDIDLVDSFSAAKAQVSRLEQELAGLQAPVPIAKSKLSVSVSNAIKDRGSMLDTILAHNPTAARQIVSNIIEDNPQNVRTLGVTEESLAERVLPNANDGLGVHAAALSNRTSLYQKFEKALDDLNPSDLLTKAEVVNVPSIWAKAVQQHSTGTLYSTHSDLVRVTDSGDIVVRGVFGGSVDSGYVDFISAERALTDMFGGQGTIKVREVGSNRVPRDYVEARNDPTYNPTDVEYFVEAEQTLRIDPSYVSPFDKDWITPMIPGSPYLVSVSRRIQEDLFNGISAWSDKATRIAGFQREMLAPVTKLNANDKEVWTQMLMHGDSQEVIFQSAAEASTVLGRNVSPKAWEAYRGVRDYYDSVAAVRQRSVYKHLQMNGYKTLRDSSGAVVEDLSGMIHVRPIHLKPSIVGRPADGSDELFTPDNVWGKTIYDTRTGQSVELTDDLLDEVYTSGNSVARVSREAEFVDGSAHEFIIVKQGSSPSLIRNPMNIRTGHVDMNYKGEDSLIRQLAGGYKGGSSFKVQVRGTKNVNGEAVERLTTIGLYANAKQARIAREKLVTAEVRNGKSLEEAEKMYAEPELTREGSGELGLDMAGTFTGVPAHARKRGNVDIRTQGDQLAETLSIEESLTRSVAETRRLLNVDAIDMMKRRFAQSYASDIQNYDGFHLDFARYQFKPDVNLSRLGEAKRAHEAIENLDHALSNRQFVLFQDKLASYSQELMAADGFKAFAGKVLNDLSKTKVDQEIKKLVATLLIAARPLYQMVANTTQAAYLLAANPVIFGSTLRKTAGVFIAMSGTKIDPRLTTAVAARMAGMTEADFTKFMANLRSSGIMRSAAGQDITALLGEAGKIEAGIHNAASTAFWKRMIPGAGGIERVGKALMIPQNLATDLSNLMAYAHSFSKTAKEKGVQNALSRSGQVEVSGHARRLSWNQNRTDQFAYQQNAASLQFMFFQHVHRMYMDLIVDPFVRTATLNKVGVSRAGTNPYAKDWITSVKTMGVISALWGAGAYPLLDNDGVTKAGQEIGATPEAMSLFQDGLVHKAVESLYEERLNVAARFSPKGAVESLFTMMFTNDGGLILGGPVHHLSDTLGKMAKLSQAYWNADPLDRKIVLELAASAASSATSGTNDFYRAMIAKNITEYIDSSGRPISHISDDAWVPILFSVQPESVQEVYEQRNDVFERKDAAEEISKITTRWALAQYAENPNSNNNLQDIWITGMKMCDVQSGDDKELARMAKEQFVKMSFDSEVLLGNLINEIITVNSSEEARGKLQELLKVYPESEYIKLAIKSLGDNDV